MTSLGYDYCLVGERFMYFKPHQTKHEKSISDEISDGLQKNFKTISPKFFYNKTGSLLFDKICKTPEYYLTRTETDILKMIQKELFLHIPINCSVVELGSGSSIKTRLILDVFKLFQNNIKYFPIDISEILKDSSQKLLDSYPELTITGIIDTYESGLNFLKEFDHDPKLIMFLGSSLGNFNSFETKQFLKSINDSMSSSDFFLLGVDLVKEKSILEKAYNDSQGITAQFNLNILCRINEELDANFDLTNFEHYSFFNENKNRIEMYIKSKTDQNVFIKKLNLHLKFVKNELIHTEFSYKYTVKKIKQLLNSSNFDIKKIWFDKNNYYSLILSSKF